MQDELPLIMEENGKRYRLLQVDETIEAGDEYYNNFQWFSIDLRYVNQPISNPIANTCFPAGHYRRAIQ